MTWEVFLKLWPVFAILAYLLATCVLLILAGHAKKTLSVHDHIRESKALRQKYLSALDAKKAGR
jgi:hypothetical protein